MQSGRLAPGRSGRRIRLATLLAAAGVLAVGAAPEGQLPGGSITRDTGQGVAPVYEGWYETPDGGIEASFGYMNRNWKEALDIPVGPDNRISPGPADQGQPTHFVPRRQIGIFTVRVPADLEREVTWTLTRQGETIEIPVNLDSVYLIEPFREGARRYPGNTPPSVRFEEDGEAGVGPPGTRATRAAVVGQPLALAAWVTDDGLGSASGDQRLPLTWGKYRGAGPVTIADTEPVVENGKAGTTATFHEPGDYTLHLRASDGSNPPGAPPFQCCWTNGYVHVTVRE